MIDAFTRISREDRLAYCRNYQRCAAFMEAWARGESPAMDNDPIIVLQHGQHFLASEGTHRVCAAI